MASIRQLIDRASEKEFAFEEPTISALIVLYATIDALAWQVSGPQKIDDDTDEREYDKGTRGDFIAWVERYLLPGSERFVRREVTGMDFYAARCGLLHAGKAESELWFKGKAQRLYYCYGDAQVEVLQDAMDRTAEGIAVYVDGLFLAFVDGVKECIAEVSRDSKRLELAAERSSKLFRLVPTTKE
jgi:hypothetical protein